MNPRIRTRVFDKETGWLIFRGLHASGGPPYCKAFRARAGVEISGPGTKSQVMKNVRNPIELKAGGRVPRGPPFQVGTEMF